MANVASIYAGQNKTDLGTPIVKPGQDLDKNAFLTILAAELANQDPTADIDSTQYVSQLAQFAAMEQMTNLNNTMTKFANQNLVGKGATVSNVDAQGVQITGIIQSVSTTTSGTTIHMTVNENGKNVIKDFPVENIVSIVEVPDYSIPPLTNINGNMSFLLASSFINKEVQIVDQDENGKDLPAVTGTVKGTYKDNGAIKVRVELESGEIKEYSYDKIVKVGDFSSEDVENSTDNE
ncbi:MAG: flagellar biosynthesis protein FlgD [Clostridiales bacterium]|nr:flagellar biosynthesis protein FlgD [Clostridiales bacterium]